ncbi:flagellar biosynthesis protein FlhF, partial [Acidimicrobiaceae bacterium USS-CC1]|nr:flagellar biosynthesis protein FlhF [Acidiferrimicrobium australe]
MEEAVEAARGALGPSARILAADRVRSGGVGGWFARERVEVTAEVDDAPGPL